MEHWIWNSIRDEDVDVAAHIIHHYATAILTLLCKQRSKIKLYIWSPDQFIPERNRTDDNGHCWPDYAYLRGRAIDGAGLERIQVEPVAHVIRDFPESTIWCGPY